MTYILKNNYSGNAQKSHWKSIFKLLIGGGLIVLCFYFLGSFTGDITSKILAPFMKVRNSVWNSIFEGSGFLASKAGLLAENESLKQRVWELEAVLAERDMLLGESRPELSLEDSRQGFISATILSLPPRTPYDTVIIDKGEQDGITIGNNVFLANSIQVGTIESLFGNTSRVRMFSSSGVNTEVVSLRTGESIEIVGAGGGNFKTELPLGFDIEEGDLFSLLGKQIMVAKVSGVKREEASPFLSIILTIPMKLKGDSILYVER